MREAELAGAILASWGTLDGLAGVVSRRRLDRYVSIEERQECLSLLRRIAEVAPVSHRDPGSEEI